MAGLGKLLIVSGVVLVLAGVVVSTAGRLPWLGRLPGDILVRRGNFTFYFPLVTSIVISIVLSILVAFLRR